MIAFFVWKISVFLEKKLIVFHYIFWKIMFSSRSFTSNHLHLSSGGTAPKKEFLDTYLEPAKKRFKTCWTSCHYKSQNLACYLPNHGPSLFRKGVSSYEEEARSLSLPSPLKLRVVSSLCKARWRVKFCGISIWNTLVLITMTTQQRKTSSYYYCLNTTSTFKLTGRRKTLFKKRNFSQQNMCFVFVQRPQTFGVR